jgi:hypothetical protein
MQTETNAWSSGGIGMAAAQRISASACGSAARRLKRMALMRASDGAP